MDKYCSFCGKDRSYGNSVYDWILKLSDCPISPGPGEGAVFDIMIPPQLGKDHFFCGVGCLRGWINNQSKL